MGKTSSADSAADDPSGCFTLVAVRARPDASTFRQAWDVALDYAMALSRALHGVANP